MYLYWYWQLKLKSMFFLSMLFEVVWLSITFVTSRTFILVRIQALPKVAKENDPTINNFFFTNFTFEFCISQNVHHLDDVINWLICMNFGLFHKHFVFSIYILWQIVSIKINFFFIFSWTAVIVYQLSSGK